jgi:hypothetical protein
MGRVNLADGIMIALILIFVLLTAWAGSHNDEDNQRDEAEK